MEYILLGIVVVTIFIVIGIYNRLVGLRQTREQAFADIDVQLKQRFDLIPNLVETVKGYAKHEEDVFTQVTEARAGVRNAGAGSSDIAARGAAEGLLGGAMLNLFAVAENYPDLKADTQYQKLMDELSDIENKIAAARRFFNNATSELNTAVQQFPAVLFAGPMGFKTEEFFEIDEAQREIVEKAPEVNFS